MTDDEWRKDLRENFAVGGQIGGNLWLIGDAEGKTRRDCIEIPRPKHVAQSIGEQLNASTERCRMNLTAWRFAKNCIPRSINYKRISTSG